MIFEQNQELEVDESSESLPEIVRSMNWIIEGKIAIGNFGIAIEPELLKAHGFRSVVGLTPHLAGKTAQDMGVEALEIFPLTDGAGNDYRLFERAVLTLADFAEKYMPCLVHCHAGRSRSVIVVAAYLKGSLGLESDEALRLVTDKRESSVTPALLDLLERYSP